jgi:NarL family two-component system response regulator LiaR
LAAAGVIQMKKTVLFYGLALAFLIALLKSLEYRYFVRSLSLEIYLGALATIFTVLGVWIGLKFTQRTTPEWQAQPVFSEIEPSPPPTTVKPDRPAPETFGISNRELEVLGLMAQGHSNQEIADQLFVSLNTVKTHSSNLYAKLDVKRRTQAIQKAKALNIIS